MSLDDLPCLEKTGHPRVMLDPQALNSPHLSDLQRQLLLILPRFANQMSTADQLAHVLGYRPGLGTRMLVSQALHGLSRLEPEPAVDWLPAQLAGHQARWRLSPHLKVWVDDLRRPCQPTRDQSGQNWKLTGAPPLVDQTLPPPPPAGPPTNTSVRLDSRRKNWR